MAAGSQAGGNGGAEDVRDFLDEALRTRVIDEDTHLRLRLALERRERIRRALAQAPSTGAAVAPSPVEPVAPSTPAFPPPPPPAARVPTIPAAPRTQPRRRVAPTHPSWWKEPEPPPERAAWAQWLGRVRDLISSDLALHGLAYLGVLLVFVGVFGFVVFAYGELDRSLRPVAEATVPLSCFVAAWFLRRQRAPHVAVGLEMLGGLTLPLVVYASFVDGAPVPPDLTEGALIVALAAASSVICALFATWGVHRPGSALRFLVAPMAWMTVWALGLSFADEPVVGVAIRQPNPWQMTAFTLAVVISLGVATAFPRGRFAPETRMAAIPGLALGYGLALAIGFEEGWLAGPVAITGAATVIGIDLLAAGTHGRVAVGARLAQSLVVVFTVAALLPDLEVGWSGAAITLAAIALLERWGRGEEGRLEWTIALAELAAGLAMSTQEPWAMVVAFGAASVWAHLHRVVGFAALGAPAHAEVPRWSFADAAAVLLPLGVGVGLWEALGAQEGLLVSALVLVAAAVGYSFVGTDRLASVWLVASAGTVDLALAAPWYSEGPSSTLLVTAIVAACVILAVSPPGVPRVWSASAALAWAGFLGMDLAELGVEDRAVLAATTGFVVVLAGVVAGARAAGQAGVPLHLEAVGQVVTGAALVAVVRTPGGARLACLGAWTLGWLIVVAAGELRGYPATTLGRASRVAVPTVALISLPVFAVDAARAVGLLEDRPAMAAVVLSALALLEAAVTRVIAHRRPLAQLVAWGAFALGLVAIAAATDDRWPLIAACAALIGVVVVIPAAMRAGAMIWGAWIASAALAVLLAERAGVPTEHLYAAGFTWSTVALLGGLVLDERLAGKRPQGASIRTPWLAPPFVLGALGLAVSLSLTAAEPPSVFGWWMLGGAAVSLVAALLLRAAWVSGISWGLAAFGAASLARDLVLDDPWILVTAAAFMLGASWALLRTTGPTEDPWLRWDLPPFLIAHAVAAGGLARAAWIDEVAPTWLEAAALAFAVAGVLRRWPWAVAGAMLAAIGSWDLGPGPLAAVLAAESLGAGIAASRAEGELRLLLQIVSATLLGGAWMQLAEAAGWSDELTLRATAIASGMVLVAVAAPIRLRRLAADWLVPAAGLAAVGVLFVESGGRPAVGPLTLEPSVQLALALAFAMATAALAMSAAPVGRPRLRETASLMAAAALGELLLGLEVSVATAVAVLVTSSVLSTVVALVLWRTGTWRAWTPAIGIFGGLAAVVSVPVAVSLWPERTPLVAALLASGIETAAAGLVLRRTEPLVVAPLILLGAWTVFATEAFAGEPQWFTVPIGLAALAVVEVLRWDHRRRAVQVRTPEIVALDVAGIAFLIGASPIQVLQGSIWAGLVGLALGILVAAWGALTHVRRRLWLGVAAAVGCPLLMVLVPLARSLPDVASAAPWALLTVIGVAVVAIATALERGRARLHAALHHIGELLHDWE